MNDQPANESDRNRGITRRNFLRIGCSAILGGTAACVLGPLYLTRIEPSWIEIVKRHIRLSGLPIALDGLAIAQLSDFHLGPYVSVEHIRHCVELANSLRADLIVLTGDFVYESESYSATCAQALALLRAKYGVFAVLGNHDIWTNADEVAKKLSEVNIVVLHDEMLSLAIESTHLWLLGIEDTGHTGGLFCDFREMWKSAAEELVLMLKAIPSNEVRLLLVHNPDFTEMLPKGRIDLALCGHTHGGQVRIPFFGAPVVPSCFGQKYVSGLVDGPHTLVHINRGIGLIPPAVRFNCRPEITMLYLTRG